MVVLPAWLVKKLLCFVLFSVFVSENWNELVASLPSAAELESCSTTFILKPNPEIYSQRNKYSVSTFDLPVCEAQLCSTLVQLIYTLCLWFPSRCLARDCFQSPIFLQLRVKSRGQRGLKVTLVRGYNLESLWLCLLQNKVEELNQRLRQAIDGQSVNILPKNTGNIWKINTTNSVKLLLQLQTLVIDCMFLFKMPDIVKTYSCRTTLTEESIYFSVNSLYCKDHFIASYTNVL